MYPNLRPTDLVAKLARVNQNSTLRVLSNTYSPDFPVDARTRTAVREALGEVAAFLDMSPKEICEFGPDAATRATPEQVVACHTAYVDLIDSRG
jgi:hypothetical protein